MIRKLSDFTNQKMICPHYQDNRCQMKDRNCLEPIALIAQNGEALRICGFPIIYDLRDRRTWRGLET